MIIKLLTENHLEFLSSTGGCRGSSESTLVKMSNCWKSNAATHKFAKMKRKHFTGNVVRSKYFNRQLNEIW